MSSVLRADLDKNPAEVSGMFDQIATAYDRANRVLTFGVDAFWRRATTAALAPVWGERILDLAAGTGSSSVSLARRGAEVVAADFSPGMQREGERRHGHIPGLSFVHADATDLPFDDNTFDAVTISFGLRNVNNPKRALAEMLRVTAPGGRLMVCEFSHPTHRVVGAGYFWYNEHVLPALARRVSLNPSAYGYLGESIRAWPPQRTLARWIRAAGWRQVAYRNLTGGIVALHRANKPALAASR